MSIFLYIYLPVLFVKMLYIQQNIETVINFIFPQSYFPNQIFLWELCIFNMLVKTYSLIFVGVFVFFCRIIGFSLYANQKNMRCLYFRRIMVDVFTQKINVADRVSSSKVVVIFKLNDGNGKLSWDQCL